MRRASIAVVLMVSLVLLVSGCGTKDSSSVVQDLSQRVSKMESYSATGTMKLYTGEDPLTYQVQVWYQKPHFYRISLTSANKDTTQIVLRNDEGVFVLTPHLNKMFRFQSNWPDQNGQVYLYQSLVNGIVTDKERKLTTDKNQYVFDVAANYQNSNLSRQRIWLNTKTYAPQQVEVLDDQGNVLVKVEFNKFEFGKQFDKDSFDVQRNMQSSKLESLPTMLNTFEQDQQKTTDLQSAGKLPADNSKAQAAQTSGKEDFGVIEPSYMPKGVSKKSVNDVQTGENKGVMLRYEGAYYYTLVEQRPQSQTVSMVPGTLVDLGYTVGVLIGNNQKSMDWTYNGVEFRLMAD